MALEANIFALICLLLHTHTHTYESEVKVLVTQSCPTLWDPMDCSQPDCSVHGILQARILQWVAIPFSRGSSQPRDRTRVSFTAGSFFTNWAKINHIFFFFLQTHLYLYYAKHEFILMPPILVHYLVVHSVLLHVFVYDLPLQQWETQLPPSDIYYLIFQFQQTHIEVSDNSTPTGRNFTNYSTELMCLWSAYFRMLLPPAL